MIIYGGTNINGNLDKGLQIGNVINLKAKAEDGKISLTWEDPKDITYNGKILAQWKGTKVIYKTNDYPINENDGVLVTNSMTRNQYKDNAYIISGLTNGTTYYIQLFPYSVKKAINNNAENRIKATPTIRQVYGIKRSLSTSSTKWERTNDAIGLVANATHDGSAVRNDFDNLYPWSDIITVDMNADGTINSKYGDSDFSFTSPKGYIMTYVPEFWYSRNQVNGNELDYIATAEGDNFLYSAPFYIARNTVGGTTSKLSSKSDIANLTNVTISTLRDSSRNIGKNWGLLDIWRWSLIQLLYLVEYADYDSQTVLGKGVCSASSALKTGTCDSLGMKSGCLKNDNYSAVIYRGIENIEGNIRQLVDGINFTSSQAWICKDRNQYVSDKFASPYKQLGYKNIATDGYITKLGYDSNNPLIQMPIAVSGSSTTYIPDKSTYNGSSRVLYVGGGYNDGDYCGIWYTFWENTSSSTGSNIGGRLLYIPS